MLAAEIDSLIVAEIDLYTIGFDDDLEATTNGRSAQSETDVIEIRRRRSPVVSGFRCADLWSIRPLRCNDCNR